MADAQVVVCEHCDAMYRSLPVAAGETAVCACCGAELYHSRPLDVDWLLAMTVAAAVVFVIANAYPIAMIELQGRYNAARLWDAIVMTYQSGEQPIALVAAATTLFLPLMEIILLLYVILPLRGGWVPPAFALVMRVLNLTRPWSMIEVFMIGTLVSVVKLRGYAGVTPEPGLWGFAVLTLLMAALQHQHLHGLWSYADRFQAFAEPQERKR